MCASDDDSAIKTFYCRCLRGKKKPKAALSLTLSALAAENKKIINETLYYFGARNFEMGFWHRPFDFERAGIALGVVSVQCGAETEFSWPRLSE